MVNLSVPACGFSLNNGVRCTMRGGAGKRDAQGEAQQRTGEAETRGIADFQRRPPWG